MSPRLAPGPRVAFAALATFAAGGLLGFVAGRETARGPATALDPALEAWATAAAANFELSRDQLADLRVLLAHYERERDRLLAESLAQADGAWLDLDRRFETLIHNRILHPDQRARAEQLLAGSALASLPPPR